MESVKLLLVEVTEWIKYQSTKYFKTERERKSLNNAFCRLVVVVVKDEISQQTRNTNFFNVSPITFQLDGNFSLEIVNLIRKNPVYFTTNYYSYYRITINFIWRANLPMCIFHIAWRVTIFCKTCWAFQDFEI